MFKTANTSIIPHTWKLTNIVPTKTQQRHRQGHLIQAHILPLSNCKDTGDDPSSLHNSKHTKHTRAARVQTQHSTVTALHILNNTVAKGFNEMAPHARTITVPLDMSKAFDTINIHTLIRKLLQTNILGTISKLIANYIKGRKANATYRNHTSSQRQFKTDVPQGGVLSPTLFLTFTPQTYHHQVNLFRSWSTQMTLPSHPPTQAAVQPRNIYNHTYIQFLPGQNKTISC